LNLNIAISKPQIIRSNPSDDQTRFTDAEVEEFLRAGLEIFHDWQQAFDFFNDVLWDGALPDAIITSTRKANVSGYFAPDRFERIDGRHVAEIGINTTLLAVRSPRDSLSTLVHEMTHGWRFYLGPLNRNGKRVCTGYHDLIWGAEMERIGLMPSATGAPGGKRTGYRMTHYIVEDGLFDRACSELLASGLQINWADRVVHRKQPGVDPNDPETGAEIATKRDRIKFTCGSCGLNAWAKPSAQLACATCALNLTSELAKECHDV